MRGPPYGQSSKPRCRRPHWPSASSNPQLRANVIANACVTLLWTLPPEAARPYRAASHPPACRDNGKECGAVATPRRNLCFLRFKPANVRFTPNSGHVQRTSACPLSANSGHYLTRSLRRRGRASAPIFLSSLRSIPAKHCEIKTYNSDRPERCRLCI